MSLAVDLVTLFAGAWALAVLALALLQGPLIYRPETGAATPEEAGTPWLREVRDDKRLLGWWVPPASADRPVLLAFYGNKGNLARLASKSTPWHHWGFGLFLVAYRGYEGNPGCPSERSLTEDGLTALEWLRAEGYTKDRIVLYGESLGSSPACRLAAKGLGRALILEAPFSSLLELASERHPWAPVRLLLRHRHDNRPYLAGLKMPVLILHGDADRTTPMKHSHRLAQLGGRNVQLKIIPGGGHLNLHNHGAGRVLSDFLTGL